MGFETSELDRRLANIIRLGVIAQADHGLKKVRVTSGDITTTWLPQPCEIGKNYRRWHPLRVGTQVVLACPGGDLAQAVVIGMLYTDTLTAPVGGESRDVIEYNDGTRIAYDSERHHLSATLPQQGTAAITAPGGITLNGDTRINGAVAIKGDIAFKGSMTQEGHITSSGNIIGRADVEVDL